MTPASMALGAGRWPAANWAMPRATVLHWWARPHLFVLFFQLPLFIACASIPHEIFLNWKHAQNFVDETAFAAAISSMVAFALAARVASRIGARHVVASRIGTDRFIRRVQYRFMVKGLLVITLAAYVMLLAPAIANPAMTVSFLGGGMSAWEMREQLGQVPGVTSLVNLGPLYATMLFLQPTLTGQRLSRFDKLAFLVFLVFVVARVFLWSERLALLEALIPVAIIKFAPVGRHRLFIASLPILAVLALGLFFGLTEYFRSWSAYSDTGVPLTEFVMTRLLGYYATSINNGAILITAFEPLYMPYSTAGWFFKFPLFTDPTATIEQFGTAFRNFGNPEFNNTSGVFAPISDFGEVSGIAIWILLGAVTGRLFAGFIHGRLFCMFLFPTWMTGVYEMLRIFYWGDQRYFPVLLIAPIFAWLLARSTVSSEALFRSDLFHLARARR